MSDKVLRRWSGSGESKTMSIALTSAAMRSNADADPSAFADAPIGLTSRSLPAQLADRLLDAILAGRLPPGARLKELSLAQEHAVSRATVREALILLEKSRFVERTPRFGARVATPITQDVLQLFEVRGALLGVAASLARARIARMSSVISAASWIRCFAIRTGMPIRSNSRSYPSPRNTFCCVPAAIGI
ncbi:GntR family transcriptional regulator [Methylobacterium oryzae CBMB20]